MKVKEKRLELFERIIHDIKTPTNAQINALESFLITSSEKINQEEKDLIKLTLSSCLYVQKLIENFNCIYKLNFENLKLNYEKFNIIQVVEDLINEFDILLKYCEINVVFNKNINNEEINIFADKIKIKKAIENILYNCINKAFKNSQLEISISSEKETCIFQVKNRSLHSESNNNLTLFLSKEIIHAHYGKMINDNHDDNINIIGFSIPAK